MNSIPKSKVYKTYATQRIEPEEAKTLFKNAKRVIQCNLKGIPVIEENTRIYKISSSTPDRSHDIVEASGVILDHYKNNPVVAAFHNYDAPSIGRATEIAVFNEYILAKMEWARKGLNPEADIIHDLDDAGMMGAVSIGFAPTEEGYERNDLGGYRFKEWELYEFSHVLVPDQPEAGPMLRSKGLDPDKIMAEQEARMEKLEQEAKAVPHAPGQPANEPEATAPAAEDATTKDAPTTTEPPVAPENTTPATEPAPAKGDLAKEPETKSEPAAETTVTDDSSISTLTIGQLKALVAAQPAAPVVTEQKDVDQVIALTYILDELSFLIFYFTEIQEVSQPSIDKLNQALELVLAVVKEQAELGKKEIALQPFEFKDGKLLFYKEGRAISAENEKKLTAACDYMNKAVDHVQTVLASSETEPSTESIYPGTGDEGKTASETAKKEQETSVNTLLVQLRKTLVDTNKKQDATLHKLSIASQLLQSYSTTKGGEK